MLLKDSQKLIRKRWKYIFNTRAHLTNLRLKLKCIEELEQHAEITNVPH